MIGSASRFLSVPGVLLGVATMLIWGGPVSAQSALGAGGLGIPIQALNARSISLGSMGPGLFGSGLTPSNPQGAAQAGLPSIAASLQPTWGTYSRPLGGGDLQGMRFPLLAVTYPITPELGFITASLGSFLDQRWAAERGS